MLAAETMLERAVECQLVYVYLQQETKTEREGKAKAADRLRQGAAGRHPLSQARQASSESRDIYDATG